MLKDKDYEKIVPFIWKIEEDEIIIPGELVTKFGVSTEDIYIVLASLAEIGVTTICYAPLCPDCGYPITMPVDDMKYLSGNESCDQCGSKIDLENTIVLFRKAMNTITKGEYDAQRRIANRNSQRASQRSRIVH